MRLKKYNHHLKNIDEFGQNLGLKKDAQVILELEHGQKEDEKILRLKNGDFNGAHPWFVIDEEDKIHTMIPLKTLTNLLESLKKIQRDNFELRLEKALYQQVPLDFNDAWAVAMDAIKRLGKEGFLEAGLDLDKLVKELKKEHPNLFVDVESVVQKMRENERL
ncbi:DUF2603 domain-containing protein [Campylobacter sp.]|uniref:DUF2603 domain-containing protein n=1 Tax=Campylobacter sp. TaxID=205 RepID=UPI0026DB859E|nr:DUF2603 domain-containing protein [Campylobacter sp.]MDO4674212.1 DUF2603 domain-containing protein [Campylobacter sp.]